MTRPPSPITAQEERILDAMAHTAARHGYAGASVARVVERAGVSRATFYESFADREACFLAAYRRITWDVREDIRGASTRSRAEDRPRAVLEAFLRRVGADPDSGRLVLIEGLAGGSEIRAEREGLIADAEAAIESYLSDRPVDARALQVPAAALLGGVGGAVSMRVFRGETTGLDTLAEQLLAWIESYSIPPAECRWDQRRWAALGQTAARLFRRPAPNAGELSLLPRGRGALPVHEAGAARRERIVAATARCARERGYEALRVSDITASARVTRAAFYSHFRGKEDAFLAAQTKALREGIAVTAGEFFVPSAWPERVWKAGLAILSYMASNPDLSHLEVMEANSAGTAAIHRDYDNRMAFAFFLEDGYRQTPRAARLPRVCSEAIAGAIFALMRRQLAAGRGEEMLEILPAAAYVSLAPFVGALEASRFIENKLGLTEDSTAV